MEEGIVMQEHWNIKKYKEYLQGKGNKVFDGGRSKYGAVKTSVDGHTFDSKKEAEYYCELKARLQAKDIRGFCLQSTFILAPGLKYKADFVVIDKEEKAEVIDVKRI